MNIYQFSDYSEGCREKIDYDTQLAFKKAKYSNDFISVVEID